MLALDVQPDGSLTRQREFGNLHGGQDGSAVDAQGRVSLCYKTDAASRDLGDPTPRARATPPSACRLSIARTTRAASLPTPWIIVDDMAC